MRMALEFSKKGLTKYISHLDVQRAFSRAIRRSGLPVKLSQGFNPHYVVSFASALALGLESECECVEMVLAEEMAPADFLARMAKALPPGLPARRAVRIAEGSPKLMAALCEAEYCVELKNITIDEIKPAVCDIISDSEIIAVKFAKGKEKQFDMRPLIVSMETDGEMLMLRLSAAQTGALKPELLMRELIARTTPFDYAITRTRLLVNKDGETVDLLDAVKG